MAYLYKSAQELLDATAVDLDDNFKAVFDYISLQGWRIVSIGYSADGLPSTFVFEVPDRKTVTSRDW